VGDTTGCKPGQDTQRLATALRRVVDADLPVRVVVPSFAGGISDGQRNGTPEMLDDTCMTCTGETLSRLRQRRQLTKQTT
jgi:hypothetical protein